MPTGKSYVGVHVSVRGSEAARHACGVAVLHEF